MIWRLLVEIGKDLLKSLLVKLVLTVIDAFFVNYRQSQRARFA
jgi:hypothetical protein